MDLNRSNTPSSSLPTTVGALLAEEWTIDPFSVLPSVVELCLVQDADQSFSKALSSAFESIQERLERVSAVDVEDETDESSDEETSSLTWQSLHRRLVQCRVQGARKAKDLLSKYSLELQCLFLYLIQRSCLNSPASATLSETLYGTKRVKILPASSSKDNGGRRATLGPLTSVDKTRLALLLVGLPYLRQLLNHLYQRWKRQERLNQVSPEQPPESSSIERRHRGRRLFLALYPPTLDCLDMVNILCRWRYLLGRSFSFDVPSLLLGQVVRRVTQQDRDENNSRLFSRNATSSASSAPQGSNNEPPVQALDSHPSLARKVVAYFILTSVLSSSLAWLRSEYQRYRRQRQVELLLASSNRTSRTRQSVYALIPPPPPPPPRGGTAKLEVDEVPPNCCPLCHGPRVLPTASTSGHVFCLSCLLAHVRRHGTCPVTGLPCTEANLVRLYEARDAHVDEDIAHDSSS